MTLSRGRQSARAQVVDPQLCFLSKPSVSLSPRAVVAQSIRRRPFAPFFSSGPGSIPGGASNFVYLGTATRLPVVVALPVRPSFLNPPYANDLLKSSALKTVSSLNTSDHDDWSSPSAVVKPTGGAFQECGACGASCTQAEDVAVQRHLWKGTATAGGTPCATPLFS